MTSVLERLDALLPPALLWGTFTRLLALVYCVAFISLFLDAPGWTGDRGVLPASQLFSRIRKDFPSWRRFLWFPSALWFGATDRRQRTLLAIGIIASLSVAAGIGSRPALLICWIVLLSFDAAYDLTYPWECALFEAGFLALMLPPLIPFPSLSANAAPLPIVAWAYRILVARVMLGFGKTKFTRGFGREPYYLRNFMIIQPLPTPLGYFAFWLPSWLHRTALGFMMFAELVAPILLFFGGPLRLLGAGAIVALMIGIQLTGNYGYFNLLVIVLSVPILDLSSSLFSHPIIPIDDPAAMLTTLVIAVLGVGWLLHAPVNNWVTLNWLKWPGWRSVGSKPVRAVAACYRQLAPFRLVHAYGIFPPRIGPSVRFLPVVEGSDDGKYWRTFRTRFPALRRELFTAVLCTAVSTAGPCALLRGIGRYLRGSIRSAHFARASIPL